MEGKHMAGKAGIELEARWKRVLEDFTASDYGVSQYCHNHKISKASLYKWSQRLEIPIKNRSSFIKVYQVDKNDMQLSPAVEEESISFIELNVPHQPMGPALPVKFELLLAQGRLLKIEAPSTWDGMAGLVKALVS
jgi:hypothetical protein